MPIFQVTAPDGRIAKIEGAEPPTDADLDQIFGVQAQPQKPMRAAQFEGLFAGADQMDKWLGKDASQVNLAVEGHENPQALKMRAANSAFLASQYGMPLEQIPDIYDQVSQDYAKRVLGVDGPLDDAGLYGKIGAHIKVEKAQDEMLTNMAGQLFEAARTGMPFQTTFEAFRTQAAQGEGYVKGREDYYRQVAQQQWAYYRNNAMRLAEPIARVSKLIGAVKSGSDLVTDSANVEETAQVLDMLSQLSTEDAEIVIQFAAGANRATKEEAAQPGFVKKMATRVLGGANTISDMVQGSFSVAAAEAKDILLGKDETTPFKDKELRRLAAQRKLIASYNDEVKPMDASSLLANGILDAAESMPRLLVSLNPAGLGINYIATQEEIRGRFEDSGVPANEAQLMAGAAAVPYVALDMVSAKMAFKGKLPGLERFLTAPATSAARLAGRAAIVGGAETVEQFSQEVLQDLTPLAVQQIGSVLSESVPDVQWTGKGGALEGVADAAPETLAALLPIILIGTGTATFKDRAYGREYLRNRNALKAIGFSNETIDLADAQTTPEASAAILQQDWDKRQIGTAEQKQAVADLNAEAIKARESLGEKIPQSTKDILAKYPDVPLLSGMMPGHLAVEVQRADGTIYAATFTGYGDAPANYYGEGTGLIMKPWLGYYKPEAGGISHGPIRPGDTVITPVPDADQWARGIRDLDAVQQAPQADIEQTAETVSAQEPTQVPVEPVVTKQPEAGFVVSDKNTGAIIGSSPSPEGAAKIVQDVRAEIAEVENGATSTKNAVVDEERKKRGLPPAMQAAKRSMGTAWTDAMRIIDANADAGSRLVNQLKETPRALTDTENAILLHRQITLQNEFDKTAQQLFDAQQSGDAQLIAEAQKNADTVSNELLDVYNVGRSAGTESGRSLAARRMMVNADYSLAAMVTRRRVANEGKPLTEQQQKEVEELAAKLDATQKALTALEQQVAEMQQAQQPARKERKGKPPEKQKGKVAAFLSEQADAARARIRERLKNANAGIDPTYVADLAIIGADYIVKGATKFSDWSKKMLAEFGEQVTPHLAEVFDQSRALKRLKDAEERAERMVTQLQTQIALQEVFPASRKQVSSEKLDALRAQIAELQSIRQNIREAIQPSQQPATREEITNKARNTRLKNQIAEIERRLAEQDFTPAEKRTPVDPDDLGRKLRAQRDLLQLEFEAQLERDRYNRLSKFGKGKENLIAAYDSARNIMASGEFSFILRQGVFTAASRPILTAKAIPDMFRALMSNPVDAQAINLRVLEHPDAAAARAAKLHLMDERATLNKQEETMVGKWAGRIPIARNFNAAATVFLNRIRFDSWRAMRPEGPVSAEKDAAIAKFVNEATGRGSLGGLEKSAVFLGRLLFAPRFLASRVQFLAGHSLWKADGEARKIIAKEYARTLVGMSVYYTLLYAAASWINDDEEAVIKIGDNPKSSSFGKVAMGQYTLDPLGGIAQVAVFLRRFTSNKFQPFDENKPEREMTGEDTYNFFRSKWHPTLGALDNLRTGKDFDGEDATVLNEAKNLLFPITWGDMIEAFQREEIEDATALSLMMLLGVGVQRYDTEEEQAAKRAEKALKALQSE